MKIESNNLVYDDQYPRCRLHIIDAKGYVELLDLGAPHCRFKKPMVKRYVSDWYWEDPVRGLRHAILYGDKWDKLPAAKHLARTR